MMPTDRDDAPSKPSHDQLVRYAKNKNIDI